MSFGDMMSSSRGPGVIGVILALTVLAGFGLLFLFAFDEGMQGGNQSLESIITYQTQEIDGLKESIRRSDKQWDKCQELLGAKNQLDDFKRENQLKSDRRNQLLKDSTALNESITATAAKFQAYQNDYRASIHRKAKGTKIAHLETRKGRGYDEVIIREVTESGVEIRHEGGSARIPPEDLPAALQADLLFNPSSKTTNKVMGDGAGAATQAAIARKLDEEPATQEQRVLSIAKKEARIAFLAAEIRELEHAILREDIKATSQAPQMRARINAGKSELQKLQDEVFGLRDKL